MIIKVLALSWKRHKIVLTSLLPDYLVLTVSKFSQQLLFFVMIFTFAVPLLEMNYFFCYDFHLCCTSLGNDPPFFFFSFSLPTVRVPLLRACECPSGTPISTY